MGRRKSNKHRRSRQKKHQQHNAPKQQRPTNPVASIPEAEKTATVHKENTSAHSEAPTNDKNVNAPPRWRNTVFWRGLAAVIELGCAVSIAYFAYTQYSVSRDQFGAMVEQNAALINQNEIMTEEIKLARKSNEAAERSAKAAEESAIAARESGNDTARSLALAEEANKMTRQAFADARKTDEDIRRSLKVSEDMTKKQLRAYLTLGSLGAMFRVVPDPPSLEARLNLINSGVTPALDIVSRATMVLKPIDYSGPFDLGKDSIAAGSRMSAEPGREWSLSIVLPVDPTALPAIEAGKVVFWVFGDITYSDAFGEDHTMQFRFRQGGRVPGTQDQFVLLIQNEGNKSD